MTSLEGLFVIIASSVFSSQLWDTVYEREKVNNESLNKVKFRLILSLASGGYLLYMFLRIIIN